MNEQIARRHVEWFKQNEPFLFRVAEHIHALRTRDRGLGSFDWGGLFDSLSQTVQKVAPALTQVYSQKKVLDAQLARAKAGLPPLETTQIAPTVKVEAGMTPEAEDAARRIAVDVTRQGVIDFTSQMKPIFFGALALGAFFLLKNKR